MITSMKIVEDSKIEVVVKSQESVDYYRQVLKIATYDIELLKGRLADLEAKKLEAESVIGFYETETAPK